MCMCGEKEKCVCIYAIQLQGGCGLDGSVVEDGPPAILRKPNLARLVGVSIPMRLVVSESPCPKSWPNIPK